MSRPERGQGRQVDPVEHERWLGILTADPWAGWRALLNDEQVPIFENEPFTGFYRDKRQDGTYAPVAIWYEGDSLFCMISGKVIGEQEGRQKWQFIAKRPISEEVYRQVAEQGKSWPDLDEGLAEQLDEQKANGHNKAPSPDSPEVMDEQIEAALTRVSEYKNIENDDQLAQAQSVRARLLELSGKADKLREKEKSPHWDAAKAVDAKWQPLVKAGKEGADAIRKSLEVYQTKKRKEIEDAQRKAAEEAARAAAAPQPSNEPAPVAKPAPAPSLTEMPTTIHGGYGRAASTTFRTTVTEITDPNALWQFIRGPEEPAGSGLYPKLHPEMRDFMLKLAQRAVDAKFSPPGIKLEEKAQVR